MTPPLPPVDRVTAARAGDLAAFAALVEATQAMAHAVAWQVLRDEAEARDVVQDAYLAAFRRLGELDEPAAFPGWLRRIVITVALNRRRLRRAQWVPLDERAAPPVLDEEERRWSEEQQRLLARAVLTLAPDERRLCELVYHGGATAERVAGLQGLEPATVRKRLQRIRDKLRKEIEMDEQHTLGARELPGDLPTRIVELLARPQLHHLPENPVGATLAALLEAVPEFAPIALPEQIDLDAAARRLGGDAVYIDRASLQRITGEKVLRYDLTLPLLLELPRPATATRLHAAGKAYRHDTESATHIQAFHQLELFALDERGTLNAFWLAGRILDAMDRALPRCEVRMTPTEYPMCARAFSLDVRRDDAWIEVLAWGEYADWVMHALGADPRRQIALGAGFGLERIAALRYGIDDIRKLASARVS